MPDKMRCRIDCFTQIVRRDIRCHADGDSQRPVQKEIRQSRGKDDGFFARPVVIVAEFHRFFFNVAQEFFGNLGHSNFRVSGGRGVVSVNRAEISLPVYECVAHGEILGHADNRVVYSHIPVRVIFAESISDNSGRFSIFGIMPEPHLIHRMEYSSMNRF